jgi:cytochrome c peroxidase
MVIPCTVAAVAAAVMFFAAGCDHRYAANHAAGPERQGVYVWQVPKGFPIPEVPAENPMTWEKVDLGRRLFYDPRLSGDGGVACASCHQPGLAFTDGRARAKGMQGNLHPRSAMSLTNVAYNATLGWDDPTITRLEDQIPVPLYNTQPPEMGAKEREVEIISRLKKDRRTRKLFNKAFPHDPSPVSMQNVIYALASFERTLISGNSAYDRWAYSAEPDALDKEQRAGARLFFSKRLSCFRCHTGFNLSGPVRYVGAESAAARFHNTALYNEDGKGAYPSPNTGLHRHTGHNSDMGKFRAPTLRNIALTAPYMHDGSIPTLEKVVTHYAAGGRSRVNPQTPISGANTDPLMTGFELTSEEKRQLIAFLHALSDQVFIRQALAQVIPKPTP